MTTFLKSAHKIMQVCMTVNHSREGLVKEYRMVYVELTRGSVSQRQVNGYPNKIVDGKDAMRRSL